VTRGPDALARLAPPDWLAAHARSAPDRLALVDGMNRLSYADLDDLVDRMAAALAEGGVRPGRAVATLLPNSSEMVVALLATLRCGAIVLPISPLYKQTEIETMLGQERPQAVFASVDGFPAVDSVLADLAAPSVLKVGVSEAPAGWRSYAELLQSARPRVEARAFEGSAPALWLYSSGSTGGSKRISRTRAQISAEASAFHATTETTTNDVVLCAVPLSHAHGLANGLLAAIYVGATLVVHERFDRRRFLTDIEAERVTIVPGSPFMFKVLAETPMKREPDVSSIRLCLTAGAPLAREVFEACRDRFGLSVRQLYGTTETGAASINLSEDVDATWASVGRPLRGVEIGVFDAQDRPLPPGIEGAIGIRSPAMFDGYEIDALNATALRRGHFFAGDLGKLDAEGRLYITGRDTLFINLSGNKADPAEVERVLAAHPKVVESVVLGIRQAGGDEIVKAVVVTREPMDAAELVEFCRGRIADFKIPRLIEFRDEIPRNALGKVLRKYLQ